LRILGLFLLGLVATACDGAGGRNADPAGIGGGKADDPDQPDTSLLDGEMLAVLDQAAGHLGDANVGGDDDDDAPGGDDGAGDDGAGSCDGACGSDQPQGACYCDAVCATNGDCCDDYQAKCGGGDDGGSNDGGNNDDGGSNDDGGGDDGGNAAGSCAGQCGGQGSDGICYCDNLCTGNGDCCGDYESQCGGSDDGGNGDGGGDPGDGGGDDGAGDPGDGGGDAGDGGGAGSCAGHCGGAGSDGVCYCDDACTESGDCCEDYGTECPSGAPAEDDDVFAAADEVEHPTGELFSGKIDDNGQTAIWLNEIDPELAVSSGDPQFAGSACLKVIDGDVNVNKVLQAAGRGAAKQGARCFVVAVVATGATGGTAAPATSVVCLVATVGGGAVGAAKSYIKQKRKDIALCTVETVGTVMTAILAAAENIGVFEMTKPDTADIEGLKDKSLECNSPSYKESNYHRDDACGPSGGNYDWGSTPDCSEGWQKLGNNEAERCAEGKIRADKLAVCHWGRIIASNTSWNGEPNKGHARAIRESGKAARDCAQLVYDNCFEDDEQTDDKETSKQKARNLICG